MKFNTTCIKLHKNKGKEGERKEGDEKGKGEEK